MLGRLLLRPLLSALLGLAVASAFLSALPATSGDGSSHTLPRPSYADAARDTRNVEDRVPNSSRSGSETSNEWPSIANSSNAVPSSERETTFGPTTAAIHHRAQKQPRNRWDHSAPPLTTPQLAPEWPASPENEPSRTPPQPVTPIEAFDNVGGSLSNFYLDFDAKCGDALPHECLLLTVITSGNDVFPEDCIVDRIDYTAPEGEPRNGTESLEPGTAVTVLAVCPSNAIEAFSGGTLPEYRAAQQATLDLCLESPLFECISFAERTSGEMTSPHACLVVVEYSHPASGDATRTSEGRTFVRRGTNALATITCAP